MPKNLLQDMVKVKRTVRNIQAPSREKNEIKIESFFPTKESHKKRNALWIVAIISFLFLIFAISHLFSKATVTVNPKVKDVVLNENLSATKDGSSDSLPFDLIVISGEENQTVQTTEQKDVSIKAQGVVIIYNAFSSKTQLLTIDTRLEGSNGKIYKTQKAVVVPGMKGSIPGSIEVGIYGDVAGPAYNSGPLDFKIFGFKGTAKYAKFYARSNINDSITKGQITGGFTGKSPYISPAETASVLNSLSTTLQAELFKKATGQIPSGFILFKDAVFFNTNGGGVDNSFSKDNSLSMNLKGTLYGFLFDEKKLTTKIATDNIDKYDSSDVYISNIRDLNFSLANKDNTSFSDVKNINFTLSGNTKIIWRVDESKLVADLLGKAKQDFNQILLQYPNIDSAQSILSPFWKNSFPDNIKDIKLIVNYPN